MAEQKIGVVIHYWTKLEVAGVRITDGELKVGDTVHILGHTTDFTQHVGSLHIGPNAVESARAGDDVGLKVGEYTREHDEVYKVTED